MNTILFFKRVEDIKEKDYMLFVPKNEDSIHKEGIIITGHQGILAKLQSKKSDNLNSIILKGNDVIKSIIALDDDYIEVKDKNYHLEKIKSYIKVEICNYKDDDLIADIEEIIVEKGIEFKFERVISEGFALVLENGMLYLALEKPKKLCIKTK